jgi:hypothetical protein
MKYAVQVAQCSDNITEQGLRVSASLASYDHWRRWPGIQEGFDVRPVPEEDLQPQTTPRHEYDMSLSLTPERKEGLFGGITD